MICGSTSQATPIFNILNSTVHQWKIWSLNIKKYSFCWATCNSPYWQKLTSKRRFTFLVYRGFVSLETELATPDEKWLWGMMVPTCNQILLLLMGKKMWFFLQWVSMVSCLHVEVITYMGHDLIHHNKQCSSKSSVTNLVSSHCNLCNQATLQILTSRYAKLQGWMMLSLFFAQGGFSMN